MHACDNAGHEVIAPFQFLSASPQTLPDFYWNVYSQEQRWKFLCCNLQALAEFANSFGVNIDGLKADIAKLEGEFDKFKESGFLDYYEAQLVQWINEHMPDYISMAIKMVFFGLTDNGYFCAYIPDSWKEIQFDTGMVYGSTAYGRLILRYDADGSGVIDNTSAGFPTIEELMALKVDVNRLNKTAYTPIQINDPLG